jgi:hypothetical protein
VIGYLLPLLPQDVIDGREVQLHIVIEYDQLCVRLFVMTVVVLYTVALQFPVFLVGSLISRPWTL